MKKFDPKNPSQADIQALTNLAGRALSPDEKKEMEEKVTKKLQFYEDKYQAGMKENTDLRNMYNDLVDKFKAQEKNFNSMVELNKSLKEIVDESKEDNRLMHRYCNAIKLLHKNSEAVWNMEVCVELASKFDAHYMKAAEGYMRDIQKAIRITWNVSDKKITPEEGIDQIHKLFVKEEGISEEMNARMYAAIMSSDAETKKVMMQELKSADAEINNLRRENQSTPQLDNLQKDIQKLQVDMSNPDNYPKE